MNCTSHPLPSGEKIGLSNNSNGSPPLKTGTVHPPLIAKSPESQNALPLLKVVAYVKKKYIIIFWYFIISNKVFILFFLNKMVMVSNNKRPINYMF